MTTDSVFVAVAAKTLSAVEVDPSSSNQHELAAGTLRRLLIDHGLMRPDAHRVDIPVGILQLTDDEAPERIEDRLTVYDARRQQEHRGPEWRAYYGQNSPAEQLVQTMREGDRLVYAIDRAGGAHVLLVDAKSRWSSVLADALAISETPRLMSVPKYDLASAQRKNPIALIADALGITPPDDSDEEWLLERFGGSLPLQFPDTSMMASLAHERVGLEPQAENADLIIERWLTVETELFRILEQVDGDRRLEACKDFDDYVRTVLSILQRRKARRGRSLEIHLETLLAARRVPFERQVETEPGSTSDFIIPGIDAYRGLADGASDAVGVLHLGAKSTARERWKQVLSEARLLQRKHLATLDPNLSDASLRSMGDHNVIPVMPERLAALYPEHDIMHFEGFIERAQWTVGASGPFGT